MSAGTLANRYELQQLVNQGPILDLWTASDRIQGIEVSIRVVRPPFSGEEAFLEALRNTIEVQPAVKHPGVERITSLEIADERVFLVGDPVRGMSLAERIHKLAPFSVPVAVATGVTIAEALAALHRAGVVHGDVGTHNIRVLPEGTAILQMAGIWAAYSSSRSAGPSVLPDMAAFLAPEVSQGELPSPASDVYSAGVILYWLLAGKPPFSAEQPVAMAMKHVTEELVPVREVNPNVPIALDEVIKKCLSKSKHDRYGSATELLSDLRMIQDAMRFGRSLTWPLTTPSPASTVAETQSVPSKFVPPAEVDERPKRNERSSGDVPNWLKGVMVFFAALVVLLIGTFLFTNLQKPKLVTVPDLRGESFSKAEEQLKPLKVRLRVARKEISESDPADEILDMDPTPGEKIYEGGTISVVVSAGSRFVEVPDLRGMTVDKARLLLDSLDLKLDESIEEEYDREAVRGMVLRQVPTSGSRVERRTAIRLTISSGTQSPRGKGNANAKYVYTIRIELTDINEPVMMRVDMTDARNTKTISEEERQPGELVELTAEGYGDQAIFRIFYDGEPVTQITKRADEAVDR